MAPRTAQISSINLLLLICCLIGQPAWAAVTPRAAVTLRIPDGPVTAGSEAVLSCRLSVSSSDGVSRDRVGGLWWQRIDGARRLTEVGRVSQANGTLRIAPVLMSDAGEYVCLAATDAGQLRSPPARLTVISQPPDRPVFEVRPRDQTVLAGESATFDCSAAAGPAADLLGVWRSRRPALNWRREALDGEPRPMPPQGRSRLHDNGSLTVSRVTAADAGRYICEAASAAGTKAESVARLTVLQRPSFLETPSDATAAVGDRIVLACRAAGNPPPTVYWSKGFGRFVFAVGDMNDDSEDGLRVGVDGSLTISPVELRHAGQFQCHATNAAGSAQAAARLTVLTSTAISTSGSTAVAPPFGEGPPAVAVVALGSELRLPCRLAKPIDGSRTVWLRRSFNSERLEELRAEPDGSWLLAAARMSDSGRCTCAVDVPGFGLTEWPEVVNVTVVDSAHEPLPEPTGRSPKEAPHSVEVVDTGSDWALLRVGDLCQRVYRIERLCSGDRSWQRYSGLFESRLVKADRLPADAECRFLARAVAADCGQDLPDSALAPRLPLTSPSPVSMPVRTPRPTRRRHWHRLELRAGADGGDAGGWVRVRDLVVTPLDRSLSVASWRLDGTTAARAGVVGFRVAYSREPLSNCLATDAVAAPVANDSVAEVGFCSLTAGPEALAEHLREARLAFERHAESVSPLDESVDVVAADDNEDGRPRHRALLQRRLRAFACYSVLVRPLPQGQPERRLSLSREDAPSAAPANITVEWLPPETPGKQRRQLRVSWRAPKLDQRNGVLTATQIYVFADSALGGTFTRAARRVLSVPFPAQSANLSGLSLDGSYRLILSSRNCRGEGIRSPPVRVGPPYGDEAWWQDRRRLAASAARGPWFLAVMASGACLWLGLCAFVAFALRRRPGWLARSCAPLESCNSEKVAAPTVASADSFPLLLPPLMQPASWQQLQQHQQPQPQQQLVSLSGQQPLPARAASPYASASVVRRVAGFSDEYSVDVDGSLREAVEDSWDSFAPSAEAIDSQWKLDSWSTQNPRQPAHHRSPSLDSCLSRGSRCHRLHRRRRRQRRRFRELSVSTTDSDELRDATGTEVGGSNPQRPV